MKDKKIREKKGRITLITALAIITALSLSFAFSSFIPYILAGTSEGQITKAVIYKSPLVWRVDGKGDFLLPELSANATHELVNAVETPAQIETLTATWEFKGEVRLEVSANNGEDYIPAVYGVPVTSHKSYPNTLTGTGGHRQVTSDSEGLVSGNKIKWKATLGPDSELTEIKIAYTDIEGGGGTFGRPELSGFKFRKQKKQEAVNVTFRLY